MPRPRPRPTMTLMDERPFLASPSSCTHCGGALAAAHMLTRTYPIDGDGLWQRTLADFVEDVVVVCATCGEQQDGRIDEDGGRFAFLRGDAGKT